MHLRGITVIFLAIVQQYSLCYGKMDASRDPVQEFLQLDADTQHEFVKIEFPERLHKRAYSGPTLPAGMRMKFRAFGENVNLWLHPKDSMLVSEHTPVYYSMSSPGRPGNVSIVQQHGLMENLGRLFMNPKYLASLVIGTGTYGRRTVNGQISSKNLVVRSLPESVVKEYARKRRSTDDLDDDYFNSINHVVYRTNDDVEKSNLPSAINGTMLRERLARSASGVPFILYPKILAVADYSLYKEYRGDINALLEYLLAFWNGVDLKYRGLEAPRVRLHISAIVIGVDPEAIPYISNAILSKTAFKIQQSMLAARKFFYEIRDSIPLASYNIPLTTTRLAFGEGDSANILGQGYRATACVNDSDYGVVDAIAISRDDGVFSGVFITAHELGHVFGMRHDLSQSDDCYYSNGFIMSFTPWYTKNSTSFSTCSLAEFQEELDNHNLECMYEAPPLRGGKLPKLMPGRVASLEKQCLARDRRQPCNVSTVDICVNFHCLDRDGYCWETGVAALEGTPCGDKNETPERFCVNSRCVHVL